ncbi:hypothetical protein FG152_22230 [Ochrobactrum sp. XJ1]|nr:hypothetical protein [Ochrobactrum sp. XJ1]
MSYRERKNHAVTSAERDLGGHIIRDGLVRSFRFNSLYTDKFSKLERKGDYPFASHVRSESGKYANNSNCAFTLTWTPGKMVITGDCGELTLTHYQAMGDFEDAISWALHSDFDYLLGKSNQGREYDRDATWAWFKEYLNEEVLDAVLGSRDWATKKRNPRFSQRKEIRDWQKSRPKWNKRAGQTKADFEDEMRWWIDDRPPHVFSDPTCDAWEHWNQLRDAFSIYEEQYDVTKSKDRHLLLGEAETWFETEHDACDFLYRKIGFDDPCISHDYPWRSYYLIACIQHGCRMIQKQLNLKEVA